MGDGTPLCGCGKGKMELRCAGRSSMNAGRYYYKCPVNGKHPGSFKWYDEYHDEHASRESRMETDSGQRAEPSRSLLMDDRVGLKSDVAIVVRCGLRTPYRRR
ncbi:hypothetical protein AAHA92_29419 [Salvia divinorum]|uniref:GRF-type domain-containing protein n=1 Tax=Salvia divinorum TaxID=28513 RepID=A0ABD1FYD2_SALDI